MILNRQTIIGNVLTFIILFMLSSCGSDDNKSEILSDLAIQKIYSANKLTLVSMIDFCSENISIRRLGLTPRQVRISTSPSKVPNDQLLNEMQNKLRKLGAKSLICTRDWSLATSPLVSVTIPIYNNGISVSGSSKGITYLKVMNSVTSEQIKSGELILIDESGWYIYNIKS